MSVRRSRRARSGEGGIGDWKVKGAPSHAVTLLPFSRRSSHGAETKRQGRSTALLIPIRGVALIVGGSSPGINRIGESGSNRSMPLWESSIARAWVSLPGPLRRSDSRPRRLDHVSIPATGTPARTRTAAPVVHITTDDVGAPVDPIRAIDVEGSRRPEHRGVAGPKPVEGMAGRIVGRVCLHLSEPTSVRTPPTLLIKCQPSNSGAAWSAGPRRNGGTSRLTFLGGGPVNLESQLSDLLDDSIASTLVL